MGKRQLHVPFFSHKLAEDLLTELLYVPGARLMRPYVNPLNAADFKGIRAGWHFR
jgi:hypothetical protein